MVYGLWFSRLPLRSRSRRFPGGGSPLPRARALPAFKINRFTEMCCGAKAGSYLRLTDSCSTQLKAQGPSRTCNESEEEEDKEANVVVGAQGGAIFFFVTLKPSVE